MRKIFLLCALASAITGLAQTAADTFNVGPYIVNYNGKGDVRYRLRDDINLYDFFELRRDTTIVASVAPSPVGNAIQLSAYVGSNDLASWDLGIEGLWKQSISLTTHFNVGLSLAMTHRNYESHNALEVGIPLQIELGRLDRNATTFYGLVGITPTFYSTLGDEDWAAVGGTTSGLLITPNLEVGVNLPVAGKLLRVGVFAKYKINCTANDYEVADHHDPSKMVEVDYDAYANSLGRAFAGIKIGFIL